MAILLLVLAVGWILTLVGMPGNWLIVSAAALFAYVVPDDSRINIGRPVVFVLFGLALLAELMEFAAGAMGAARAGGSKRGALLSMVGAMIGGVCGVVVGLPIPAIGSVVAAVLFASVGAALGAMVGETWKGKNLEQTCRVGRGAFWGRILGSLAKTTIASAMVVIAAAATVIK